MKAQKSSGKRSRRFGFSPARRAPRLAAALSVLIATLATAAAAQAAGSTWYVAPTGSDGTCSANSSAQPFATVQAALACAHNGDTVSLAPSGSTPYQGIGPVTHNVVIKGGPGADARSVQIDLRLPTDSSGFSQGLMSVPAGASVKVQGVTLECSSTRGYGCLDPRTGSMVTNNGTLSLTGVVVTGGTHGSPLNNVSTAAGQARLTVLDSTIENNSTDGLGEGEGAAGISSTVNGGPEAQLTVVNSTIADNAGHSGVDAGAIYTNVFQAGAVTLVNDTIADNTGAGGGGIVGGNVSTNPIAAVNTLIAGNTSGSSNFGPDCQGSLLDGPGGHNLVGDPSHCSGPINGVNGDLVSVPNAGMNALGDNGGTAPTISLQPQSVAIGAGDTSTCLADPVSRVDERGKGRNVIARGCDIGAYDTAGTGGVAKHTWFVAPSGSGSDCASNSSTQPFAALQAALACAGDGDVVRVAASGAKPYPGIGAVAHSVTIKAASGANARTVKIDLGQPADGNRFSSGMMSVPASASVQLQGVTLTCDVQLNCLSQVGAGSLVTNNGALSLTGVTIIGAKHGPAINDVSAGTVPARLTMLDSAIVHNANDGLGSDAGHAGGINARSSGAGVPQPHVTVTNSTIAANVDSSGNDAGAINSDTTQAAAVTLTNDTITANEGEIGGIADGAAGRTQAVILTNTVLAANHSDSNNPATAAPDCYATLGDGPGGHNILGDDNNCPGLTDGTNGDQVGTYAAPLDSRLAPAALNGGATATAPPLNGSPVIGTANSASCLSGPVFGVDQRGVRRMGPAGTRDACDIGAHDTGGSTLSYAAPSITTAASATVSRSNPFRVTIRSTGTPTSAITETGALPNGATLVDNGDGTATIVGTPNAATAGTYPITISASNGVSPAATQSFTLTVK